MGRLYPKMVIHVVQVTGARPEPKGVQKLITGHGSIAELIAVYCAIRHALDRPSATWLMFC